jgi:hypothetical protein
MENADTDIMGGESKVSEVGDQDVAAAHVFVIDVHRGDA